MTISGEWLQESEREGRLRWRQAGALVAVLLVLMMAWSVAVRFLAGDNGQAAGTTGAVSNVAQTTSEGTGRTSGRYAQSARGAQAAARHLLQVGGGSLVSHPAAYRRAMAKMAAPEWRAKARKTSRNAAAFFRGRYGRGGSMITVPLRTEVTSFHSGAARVRLLWVSVAAGPKVVKGEQIWGRTRLNLRWVGGDWRVAGNETSSMPPPPLLPGQVPGSAARVVEGLG